MIGKTIAVTWEKNSMAWLSQAIKKIQRGDEAEDDSYDLEESSHDRERPIRDQSP